MRVFNPFDFLVKRTQFFPHVRQCFDEGIGPFGLVGVHGRGTDDRRIIWNVADHAGLGADLDHIADLDMPNHADLSPKHTVVAQHINISNTSIDNGISGAMGPIVYSGITI